MTLPEQAAVVLDALDFGFIRPADVIRWADELIAAMPKPPDWLIELSILPKPYKEEVVAVVRRNAKLPPSIRHRIELVALAWDNHLLPLRDIFSLLFRVTILERLDYEDSKLQIFDERLHSVLVEWDNQEDLDVIAPNTAEKMETMLRHYVTDASAIAQIIRLNG